MMHHLGLSPSILKTDLRASIVVFLVALPLAMGIAIASGYPPVAGLITGIIGGIVVGSISGAPLQVSGAAAGLSVLVFQGVQQFGLANMGLVILLAGIFQVAAGIGGIGRWFQAVSPTVLHAMLAGIGVLIVGSQFHVMLDFAPKGSGIANISTIPKAIEEVFSSSGHAYGFAFALGLLSIGTMLLWPKLIKGKLKVLPAPLIAVFVSGIIAWLAGLQINYVKIPDNLFTNWTFGALDFRSIIQTPALLGAALQLALIASAESLLCAGAVDQMHTGPRAKFDRELTAQGIGNVFCGVLGVLPMTGVIVRSSANLNAGATTRLSAIFHGVWLLVFALVFPEILSFIPISALAGILVYTGMKLVNIDEIRSLYRHGKTELAIYLTTLSVIVCYDLLTGVLLGLALSSIKILRQLSHLSISIEQDPSVRHLVINLRGAATFLRLPKLVRALEKVPPGASVEIKANLQLIDPACVEHIKQWRKRHSQSGGRIEFKANVFGI